MKKPELLAPAGNLEKLKLAVLYGADAVYCGGYNFGLRAGADNFTYRELREAREFTRERGARIYVTVNMIPHNEDLEELPGYLHQLQSLAVDGLIIADPGVLRIIKRENIDLPLHLSTQANAVNYESINFWAERGLKRVILARELNREEIEVIRKKTGLELEMFIHGSMCISYSGRCLLSNYLAYRDANRGECAHSCRWHYYLQEEERPGEYYPVFEGERGTYIFNSRDLCLIEALPELMALNLDSFKIEGRMKSLHYVAAVTRVYREAIDSYFTRPGDYELKREWLTELKKVSHRGYTTGFFHSPPGPDDHNYNSSGYYRSYDFLGLIREFNERKGEAVVEVRGKINRGDTVEILVPGGKSFTTTVDYIIGEEGDRVEAAPHPLECVKIPVGRRVVPYSLVRRERAVVDD